MTNKLKKTIAGAAVLSTMLTGCNTKTNNTTINTTNTTTQTIETTTEEITTTQDVITEEAITEEINVSDRYIEAATTYNEYTAFYSKTKMAYEDENASQGINISRIENMIKVINGEVADLTEDEISDAKECIGYVLLSQDLLKNLNHYVSAELGYETLHNQMNVIECPKLSIYASDKETREFVEKYELLRDKVINDLNTTNKVSDKTKEELRQAVIDMEKSYTNENSIMNTDVMAEGNKLLANLAKESLIELTVASTNEAIIYDDAFPGGLQLVAATEEEKQIINRYNKAGDKVTFELEAQALDLKTKFAVTKYTEGVCRHEENLREHAKSNTNVYSKNDLIIIRNRLEELKDDVYKYTLTA